MGHDVEVFDAARAPFLPGSCLVEASAGTGKTYAIGMLVLRGVVELGIPMSEILIVTFTKAATEELRSRVRERLAEVKRLLHLKKVGQGAEIGADDTLLDWLSQVTDVDLAIQRLQLALYDIDSASIYTIHSFCQRMLVDQALESGQLFNLELVTSVDHIIHQLADDFWRREIYSLAPLTCSLVISSFSTPDTLLASVSEVFRTSSQVEPSTPSVEDAAAACRRSLTELKLWWEKEGESLREKFSSAVEGSFFKKWLLENFDHWFAEVSAFISGDSYLLPEKLELLTYDKLVDELNGTKLRGDKKRQFLQDWNLPTKEVEAFLFTVDTLLLSVRGQLAAKRDEVGNRLLQLGVMGFDGLITNLAMALDGVKGAQLKQVIGAKFKLALIDEFQDTDNLQYKIFSELFAQGNHYLYLIGDPKQAIYKFRGADIHSYFAARTHANRQLTLGHNYRSHPHLVEEVNRLFGQRANPFLYDEAKLDYNRVEPGLDEAAYDIRQEGASLAGMMYCSLHENPDDKKGRWSSGKAADIFRGYAVREIARLLSSNPKITYNTAKGERALEPKDIAILVRSHKHAEQYQESLLDEGIPAVVNSRKSVFHTDECLDIIVLLSAITNPTDVTRLKAAMAIGWFNLSGNTLYNMWQDEECLSDWRSKMSRYQEMWLEKGLFSMMSSCLVEEEILLSIAAKPYAERTVSNIYQLIELIQDQESAENYGPGQLLQWIQNMYQEKSGAGGTELLLESDEDAVQIVTMHGAKGLEYPVVFCPYLWYSSAMLEREEYQVSVNENDSNIIDLGSQLFAKRKQQADYDQQAEELRLLYVAVTRAKVRCYIMWGDVKKHSTVRDSFSSALGYLLFPDGQCDVQSQNQRFDQLVSEHSVFHTVIGAGEVGLGYSAESCQKDLAPLTPSVRSLTTHWQMTSFSGLAALSDYTYEHTPAISAKAVEANIPVTGLPAGASFGNVVHDLLEEIDFSSFHGSPDFFNQVERKCSRYGVVAENDDMVKLIECVVSTRLPGGFSLKDTSAACTLKEMPFYFTLSTIQTGAIYEILQDDPTVLSVSDKRIRGYLTGFVDLICQVADKYYIMDYKTNYLGEDISAYTGDNLVEAMRSHNYGLQYWIYSLVLHRHLTNLMEDYDFKRHFGGVLYLFVRGMDPELDGSGVYSTIPDEAILQELALLFENGGVGE